MRKREGFLFILGLLFLRGHGLYLCLHASLLLNLYLADQAGKILMCLFLRAGWMLDGCPLPRKKQGVAVMIRQQVVGNVLLDRLQAGAEDLLHLIIQEISEAAPL